MPDRSPLNMSDDKLAAQAAEQLQLHEKQKAQTERRLDASKHQQSSALQEKLNVRLRKKEEQLRIQQENSEKNQLHSSGAVKVEAPVGSITFSLLTITNVASFLETLDEETALRAFEDINELVVKELQAHNVYKVKEEIGKFLLASQTVEDMLNLAIKVQLNFNENKWSSGIMKHPVCKRLVRPEYVNNAEAKPLFNGPRLQVGIHRGEITGKKDNAGHMTYSGITVLKTESIGNFAQGGQILLSSSTWDTVDASKLSQHHSTEPGVYKLDGFSSGCKVIEVLPASLKDRSKFFGSVCAHCSNIIKPNEQFFRALNCIWHMNHFRCFQCNADLGGSFVECEGSPYCKNCYLTKNAPKCRNCSNPITAGYINALGGYWHTDCFSCRRCLKKPSAEVQIYKHEELPYCGDCYKQIIGA